MSLPHDLSQRDLRMRSREIMDAVERGEGFTVTRDGRGIAELIPLRRRREFVPAARLLAAWRGAAAPDPDRFRADLDAASDHTVDDPYAR
ncbi:type II toxin-antitoxin system Phd/YefM family antitoxin [Agromyces archimandritae]|uniref:Type II toxin-antitoxin system prevent-host-death family antitoxin n=1 Tax=Agromyces archimandritae TaxID=2781962 RepID=A0A975FKA1_9MICO|nr:type II toxin-antitoxin system prevent-host-death family antitoxin [Agromyces archimandritae]QTX04095.1 type II toxin-antitoxin system prevent-host-death family antitoxin [Agromyces archimandritae]